MGFAMWGMHGKMSQHRGSDWTFLSCVLGCCVSGALSVWSTTCARNASTAAVILLTLLHSVR